MGTRPWRGSPGNQGSYRAGIWVLYYIREFEMCTPDLDSISLWGKMERGLGWRPGTTWDHLESRGEVLTKGSLEQKQELGSGGKTKRNIKLKEPKPSIPDGVRRRREEEKSRRTGFCLGHLPTNGTIIHIGSSEGGHVLGEGNWTSGAPFFGDF